MTIHHLALAALHIHMATLRKHGAALKWETDQTFRCYFRIQNELLDAIALNGGPVPRAFIGTLYSPSPEALQALIQQKHPRVA